MPTAKTTSPRRVARRPQLEKETPFIALIAAQEVVQEASLYLVADLPTRHCTALAHRARLHYAHNESFRRRLRSPGTSGRDLLYAYMLHWLASRLRKQAPELFARLPALYAWGGEELPPHLTVLR